jgi:hypothetical protein
MTAPTIAEDATRDATMPGCEQCGRPFTRRTASGGKPQRFCSTECRTVFHSKNRQRDQRSPTCSATPEPSATPVADCGNDGDAIIPKQPATYVYCNPHDQIVIRQGNWPDDDHYVFFSPETIPTLIARLKELAGLE